MRMTIAAAAVAAGLLAPGATVAWADDLVPADTGRGFSLSIPAGFTLRCNVPDLPDPAPVRPVCLFGRPGNEVADGGGLFCTDRATGAVEVRWIEQNFADMLKGYPTAQGWVGITVVPDQGGQPVAGMPWPTMRRDLHVVAFSPAEHNSYALLLTATIGPCVLERHINTGVPVTVDQADALEAEFRSMLAAFPNGLTVSG